MKLSLRDFADFVQVDTSIKTLSEEEQKKSIRVQITQLVQKADEKGKGDCCLTLYLVIQMCAELCLQLIQ